jgi:molybdopterin-guanine dinucleotide biosynthesis protein A
MRDIEGMVGVLVAGGEGKRLGLGIPKALVRVGEKTLYERALSILHGLEIPVMVAAPSGFPLPVTDLPVRQVTDRAGGSGPLAGVAGALVEGAGDVTIVLGIDFPFMSTLVLAELGRRLRAKPDLRAIVPAPNGRLQPLAAAYTREAGRRLVDAFDAGERSIVRAIEGLEAKVFDLPSLAREFGISRSIRSLEDSFFNLNTPEDLAEAERRVAREVER